MLVESDGDTVREAVPPRSVEPLRDTLRTAVRVPGLRVPVALSGDEAACERSPPCGDDAGSFDDA